MRLTDKSFATLNAESDRSTGQRIEPDIVAAVTNEAKIKQEHEACANKIIIQNSFIEKINAILDQFDQAITRNPNSLLKVTISEEKIFQLVLLQIDFFQSDVPMGYRDLICDILRGVVATRVSKWQELQRKLINARIKVQEKESYSALSSGGTNQVKEVSKPKRQMKVKLMDFDGCNPEHIESVIATVQSAIALIPGLLSASPQNQKVDKGTATVSSIRLENFFNQGKRLPNSPYVTRMNVITLLERLGVLQKSVNPESKSQSQHYHFDEMRGQQITDEEILNSISKLKQELENAD